MTLGEGVLRHLGGGVMSLGEGVLCHLGGGGCNVTSRRGCYVT